MNQNIDDVEFCCAVKDGSELAHYQVPVNAQVQEMLKEMLQATLQRLGDQDALNDYQPSEKYAVGEFAKIGFDDELSSHSRRLFEAHHITPNSGVLDSIEDLEYYYTRFFFNKKVHAVGVKRGGQFKVLQGKKLVIFSDSLKPLEDNVFKLDDTFDYIIAKPNILVANVSGFVHAAEIDEAIRSEALRTVATAFGDVPFLDIVPIVNAVISKKTAAGYVLSIQRRETLKDLKQDLLVSSCAKYRIKLVETEGKLAPAPGSELKFLKLLDYRYLETNLTGEDLLFEASSRFQIAPK